MPKRLPRLNRFARHAAFAGLLVLVLAAALIGQQGVAHAQAGSAYDLIAAVNAYRAANGLDPYEPDGELMAFAQAHSDYMAASGNCTHQRADGSYPRSYSIIENIVCATNLSAEGAVYSVYWADAAHQNTMLGYSGGYVGAGVAVNDAGVVYYTLDVRKGAGSTIITKVVPGPGTPYPTLIPFVPLATNTPNPDGSLIHVVGYGQTIIGIAQIYGLTVAELKALNGIPSTSNLIYPKQELVIHAANTPTITPTITKTPRPPTRTPTSTRTPRPPTATPSITPTLTATPLSLAALLPQDPQDRHSMGIILVVVCALGLVLVGASSLKLRKP